MTVVSAAPSVRHAVRRAAELLRGARFAIALTGAGISTPSGIPDFRTAGSGLWERVDPMTVASLGGFRRDLEAFFGFLRPLAVQIASAEPNAAHRAVARLEQAGRLKGVITQNIDRLHQKAGSQQVLEVHGNFRRATCLVCSRQVDGEPLLDAFVRGGTVPHCAACGGVLKPNVVLFGEVLPRRTYERAEAWCAVADVVLVIGTSLEVSPVSRLPKAAWDGGARLIIVNREPTYLDSDAEAVLRDDLIDAMPQLAAQVLDA